MSKPTYIDHGGEQVYAPPYIAKNVHFFGFVVKADKRALQANICDRYLNNPMGTPNRFVPVLGYVLVVFNIIERMYARNPPDNAKGWQPEMETAAWMLVLDTARLKLFWHHPYMIVDNPFAMAMGREIYGFPKMLGWFGGVEPGPKEPVEMGVETIVTERLDPSCQSRRLPLLKVRRRAHAPIPKTANTALGIEGFSTNILQSLKIGPKQLGPDGVGEALYMDLLQLRMSFLFMRQFRDSVDPRLASFQSVQECRTEMTKVHDFRRYGSDFEIEIFDYPTHPLRSELGLAAGMLKVEQAFWTLFDFEIGPCNEIWKAPT